ERASSCSRTVWPSCRRKLRTQPTWSAGSPCSISDWATTGCQAAWLLKSRRMAHTRSIGASMTADRTTLIMAVQLTPDEGLQMREPGLEHALADLVGQGLLSLGRTVELRRPLGEGPVAVGHRRELQRGNVVLDTHRAVE